jgi:hypothetical protein
MASSIVRPRTNKTFLGHINIEIRHTKIDFTSSPTGNSALQNFINIATKCMGHWLHVLLPPFISWIPRQNLPLKISICVLLFIWKGGMFHDNYISVSVILNEESGCNSFSMAKVYFILSKFWINSLKVITLVNKIMLFLFIDKHLPLTQLIITVMSVHET